MRVSGASPDVLIVGAGVIGLATALELRRAGLRVRVVERGAVGRGSASWAGGGILLPLAPDDVDAAQLPLLRASLSRYVPWCESLHAASGIDPQYRVSGLRVLMPADGPRWNTLADCCDLNLGFRDGAIFLPRVAQVRSPRLLRALAASLRAAGGEICEHEAALELVGDERVEGLRSTRTTHRAAVTMICAGAWSDELAPEAGVQPVRGQMLLLRARPGELPHIVLKDRRYLIPRDDGLVLAGSTLEQAGFDESTTPAARDALMETVRELAPALATREVLAQWSGLRPGRAAPIIAWSQRHRGLLINSGHHRLGITLAPGSALRAAELILSARD